MSRKEKYENAEYIRNILESRALCIKDIGSAITYNYLNLNKQEDREVLLKQCEKLKKLCEDAIEELTLKERKILKIKRNVDLKELEKFGFEISSSAIFCANLYCNGDVEVEFDRTIHHISSNSTYEDLDIIYDLIQAGLVEKVEESY